MSLKSIVEEAIKTIPNGREEFLKFMADIIHIHNVRYDEVTKKASVNINYDKFLAGFELLANDISVEAPEIPAAIDETLGPVIDAPKVM